MILNYGVTRKPRWHFTKRLAVGVTIGLGSLALAFAAIIAVATWTSPREQAAPTDLPLAAAYAAVGLTLICTGIYAHNRITKNRQATDD